MQDTTNTPPVPQGAAKVPITYGQKAVGLSFNPGNNPDVQSIKAAYAGLIDNLKTMLDAEPTYGAVGNPEMRVYSEKGQLFIEAIRQAQTAQMWAVKAVTWTN